MSADTNIVVCAVSVAKIKDGGAYDPSTAIQYATCNAETFQDTRTRLIGETILSVLKEKPGYAVLGYNTSDFPIPA